MNKFIKYCFDNWRDPVSGLTHFFGIIFALISGIILTILSLNDDIILTLSIIIFSISMIALYSASTYYHSYKGPEEKIYILKRIDHITIFTYIAGTYTPICLGPLRGTLGYVILIIIWLIAIFGIFVKIFWLSAPRVLSTSLYVIMGWISVIAIVPLYKVTSIGGVLMLLLGGISYTIGAVIYAIKKPNFGFKYFGFHEIFHIFVLIGTLFHVLFMVFYIV